MKRLLLLLLLIPLNINAKVTLNRCIDGDTAVFNIENKVQTVRFIAIDTPESTNKKEFYGKEASTYTCDKLTNSNDIVLELDANSDDYDRYNRMLAWIFVDDILLQDDIIKNGYGKVAYIYGEYKYTNKLYDSQMYAKENKLGIWQDEVDNDIYYYLILIVMILGSLLLSNKQKKGIKKVFKILNKI
jgi:micrococcal nuclease